MSVNTLNKNVLKMLSHLNKYPIPDPQMVKDFKWFIKQYDLSVKSGEVTAPGSSAACDSCCPAPNEIGATVTETTLVFKGSALSTISGFSGFEITPNITNNRRLYSVVIEITGATSESFSVYDSITELSTNLTNGIPNSFGANGLADNDPVPEEFIESVLTISSDNNETPNDLSGITVTVKLYTA
jgi:hypothetical protein